MPSCTWKTNDLRSPACPHASVAKDRLEDDKGYLMAVLPATHKVDLGVVRHQLKRELGLATESELADLFKDCEPGAIPPLGKAYGISKTQDTGLHV